MMMQHHVRFLLTANVVALLALGGGCRSCYEGDVGVGGKCASRADCRPGLACVESGGTSVCTHHCHPPQKGETDECPPGLRCRRLVTTVSSGRFRTKADLAYCLP